MLLVLRDGGLALDHLHLHGPRHEKLTPVLLLACILLWLRRVGRNGLLEDRVVLLVVIGRGRT